jgi:hypothetical protein
MIAGSPPVIVVIPLKGQDAWVPKTHRPGASR